MHKSFVLSISGIFKALQAALVAYGALGLFFIALLDAAFIPLPGGPDVVVVALSHNNHRLMPVYVLVAVVGSTIGSLFLYSIALRGGQAALQKISAAKRLRAAQLVDRYDVWALLVAAVLPPPFPFKIFVLSAGAFRMKVVRFIGALVVGRGFRFTLEGTLAVLYGEAAIDMLKRHYPAIGLGVAAIIVIFFITNNLVRRRRTESVSQGEP